MLQTVFLYFFAGMLSIAGALPRTKNADFFQAGLNAPKPVNNSHVEVNRYKIFVEVIARFEADGKILPLAIVWEDGRRFDVQKILDMRPAASLKAGGVGMRYTIIIEARERYLFLEDNRWFVEAK